MKVTEYIPSQIQPRNNYAKANGIFGPAPTNKAEDKQTLKNEI